MEWKQCEQTGSRLSLVEEVVEEVLKEDWDWENKKRVTHIDVLACFVASC
jgi:hypothetical protein